METCENKERIFSFDDIERVIQAVYKERKDEEKEERALSYRQCFWNGLIIGCITTNIVFFIIYLINH